MLTEYNAIRVFIENNMNAIFASKGISLLFGIN